LPPVNPSPLTLRPLGPAEEHLLRGRAAEIETIVENGDFGRLTVVISPPGYGASSLLRAGVQPALRRAGHIVVVCAEWEGREVAMRLRETVLQAVREQTGESCDPPPQEPLLELLQRVQSKTGKPVTVLLDQFEDYLRCHAGTDVSDAFDAELSHAVSSRAARFVIAMHPSAAGEFERFCPFIPNLLGYTVHLAPLQPDAAAELVRSCLEMETAAVAEILAAPSAAVEGGVNPSLIAIAAQRRARGGADRAILTSLDPVLNALPRSHRRLFLQWMPVLVSPDGQRIAVSLKGLYGRTAAGPHTVESLLTALIGCGLMRQVSTRFGVRYLLAREIAAPVVRDWGERTRRIHAARSQTFFRAISVLVGVVALLAAYLVYAGGK
jgi:hypothetical protein